MLQGVDLDVFSGKVTALVGDNGAGKSTLIKGIAGIHSFDKGEYFFDGKPVTRTQPARLQRARDRGRLPGPRAVRQPRRRPQHVPRPRATKGLLDEPAMETRARTTLDGLSVRTLRSVRTPVASLSGGQRQTVAIARAVLWNSKVVILDEPTAALGVAQTEQVLALVRRLADHGLGVVPDQPQPQRRLPGGRRDRGALPRQPGRDRSATPRTSPPNQVVELITSRGRPSAGATSLSRTTNGAGRVSTNTERKPPWPQPGPRALEVPGATSVRRLHHVGYKGWRRRGSAGGGRPDRAGGRVHDPDRLECSPTPSTSPT